MSEDKIIIRHLRLFARIGCTEKERQNPQQLLLSLEVTLPLKKAAESGIIEDSVCYAAAAAKCEELASQQPWVLLEQLADAVCRQILALSEKVEKVKVRLKKFALAEASWAGIEMSRSRGE